jgi:hypothetical protein
MPYSTHQECRSTKVGLSMYGIYGIWVWSVLHKWALSLLSCRKMGWKCFSACCINYMPYYHHHHTTHHTLKKMFSTCWGALLAWSQFWRGSVCCACLPVCVKLHTCMQKTCVLLYVLPANGCKYTLRACAEQEIILPDRPSIPVRYNEPAPFSIFDRGLRHI